MTKYQAQILTIHAPIIKAFSEGKQIEVHCGGLGWRLIDDPSFDREEANAYRIKPEPRTVWRVEFKSEATGEVCLSSSYHDTQQDAELFGQRNFRGYLRAVEFIEKLT